VIDPDRVQDAATFSDPHHYSTGIPHVIVNGVPVLRDSRPTGARPGVALRHAAD
jgi:N-acyl-D-aspartate/D-glutamate deacylase